MWNLFGSGVFTFLVDLVNGMNEDCEITIAYGRRQETLDNFREYFPNNVEFIEVKNFTRSINFIKDLKALLEVRKIVKNIKPDIVHLHSSKAGIIGRLGIHSKNIKMLYNPHGFYFQAIKDGRVLYKKIKELSPYFDGFMNALFYRENCYTCLYARPERISDITIGDFWGLKNDSKLYNNKDKGVSVCLPITDKGIELIKNCEKELLLEERDINEAVNGNSQLRMPSVKNNNEYNNFKKYYVKYGFYKAYKKATVYTRFKRKIKNNIIVNKIYKALKGDKNE